MHTSREARQEGKRYYTLWREKCPQEGKNIFRDRNDQFDVEIRPSECVRNARPNYNNKIWVNVVTDRFIYQGMRATGHKLSYSLEDYNFCFNDLLQIRHFRADILIIGRQLKRRREWSILLNHVRFESLTCFLANWKIQRNDPQGPPEDPMVMRLCLTTWADRVFDDETAKRRGGKHYSPTIRFELEDDLDLPPCKA